MKHLLTRLEKYGIGTRAQTENDFFAICEAEKISIEWSKERVSFYLAVPEFDIRIICLPKMRHGLKLLFAMYHELGHHFTHAGKEPIAAFHGLETDPHDRCETEADAIALVALMPKSQLQTHAFFDGSRYGGKLYNDRTRLFFLYDI